MNTILITGSAIRIGRALALHYARAGWTVAIHYNTSHADASILAAEITDAGGSTALFSADLRDEDSCTQLIPAVYDKLGPIHCLINNAAVFHYDTAQSSTTEIWDDHMQINLRAPFVLSQQFYRQLPPDQMGNIINILDQRVLNLTPHFTSYTVSKAALWTLTQTLALSFAPRVRVNGIGPGYTLAGRAEEKEKFEHAQNHLPLKASGSVEEVCKAVDFIISTPSLTGQMIALDGGQHLGWSFPKNYS
ncbi:MAG: SDR family oxidoreductase [Alphaproteobacteria bacterium]|nr:SDR family oxidoreductase [Alphaproteobacteria bacterium]